MAVTSKFTVINKSTNTNNDIVNISATKKGIFKRLRTDMSMSDSGSIQFIITLDGTIVFSGHINDFIREFLGAHTFNPADPAGTPISYFNGELILIRYDTVNNEIAFIWTPNWSFQSSFRIQANEDSATFVGDGLMSVAEWIEEV